MRVGVVGAGSWGTALAIQLSRSGDEVRLWDHRAERAQRMDAARENETYLPGIKLADNISVTGDLSVALSDAELMVAVVPSQSMRAVMRRVVPHVPTSATVLCASKGIEERSLQTMDEVLREELPAGLHERLCFLAGPSFAREVALGLPTAVVVASQNAAGADLAARALHGGAFRAYHTDDIVGAELGGALKNVIAIACGVADGMGMGLNTRAALITRGIAEITRLTVKRGGNPLTLAGLAGVGDLVLTATGDLSRNRRVGLGLGQGRTLQEILDELGQVAEGVVTTRSAKMLADQEGVEMPITEQIYAMLYENKPVESALRDLLGRERKAERG